MTRSVCIDGIDPRGWWRAECAMMEELDKLCFGGGLVGLWSAWDEKVVFFWCNVAVFTVCGNYPKTCCRVAFAFKN